MTGQGIEERLQVLSNPELAALWRAAHQAGAMGALAYVESELIRRARILAARHKGGAGSGYHSPHLGPPPGRHGGSRPRGSAGGSGEAGPEGAGEKADIENGLIAVFLAAKGGPGSGNWGHSSHTRVGKGRGGSDPGGGLGAIGLDRSATPQQRREAAQATRRGPAPTPAPTPTPAEYAQGALFGQEALTLKPPPQVRKPGDFQSLEDGKAWFESRGMEADLTGFTNVAALNESAQAIEDTLEKYPWMAEEIGPMTTRDVLDLYYEPDLVYNFRGIGSYTGADTPPKIPELGGDSFAMMESRMVYPGGERTHGGPVVYYSPRSFNTGEGSALYAQVGIVAKPNATVYGTTVHEMGHAAWDIIGMRGARSKYTGNLRWGRVSDTMKTALYDAGITERMIKRNVSWYATTNERERFAELFLMMNTPREQTNASKAFYTRLGRFRKAFNKELGWDAL